MAGQIVFYIGRVMQILGLLTAGYALLALDMGPMFKLTAIALVEFYFGYWLTIMVGER